MVAFRQAFRNGYHSSRLDFQMEEALLDRDSPKRVFVPFLAREARSIEAPTGFLEHIAFISGVAGYRISRTFDYAEENL